MKFYTIFILMFLTFSISMGCRNTVVHNASSNDVFVKAVTADASIEAQALLNFIHSMYGKKIISGQMWAPWGEFDEIEKVREITGKYPALRGHDLIHERSNADEISRLIDWWNKGGIPTLMWHWGAPSKGEGYRQSQMEIDIDRCFQEGTEEHAAMWEDLKRIADWLTVLRDARVPVLWRPLHEFSGTWFWYGKGTGEQFVRLWRTMFDYFSNERKLNNLVWVLCYADTPKADFDPGREYYDIVGADTYEEGGNRQLNDMFADLKEIHGNDIPFTLHECGPLPDPDFKDGVTWSWWMIWHTRWLTDHDEDELRKLYNHQNVITLCNIPDIMSFVDAGVVSRHGKLRVEGTQVVDRKGNPIVLRGVSLSWHNWWPRFYNADAVAHLVNDWKCTVVRAAMGIEPNGAYLSKPEWSEELICTVVDAAIANDAYVIIDWHSHNIKTEEAKVFFKKMAEKYGKYPNIIYEIFNEPERQTWEEVKKYSEEVIAVIRAIDPDNLIIVGSPHWSQDVDVAADDPIVGYSNLAYALHFYAATHHDFLRRKADVAIEKGLALFVSECAGMEATGDGPIDHEQWKLWLNFMEERKISWVVWSLSDKDETCSMLLPTASSTGDWKDDQMKEWGNIAKRTIRELNF
jgi:endoglucanase